MSQKPVALLFLSLAACSVACGGRTSGAPYDGSQLDCIPACNEPEVCDTSTGQCECPANTCCTLVDCSCTDGERHCDGATLTGCEERHVEYEHGMCGTICEHPAIEMCQSGCIEDAWSGAYCATEGAQFHNLWVASASEPVPRHSSAPIS